MLRVFGVVVSLLLLSLASSWQQDSLLHARCRARPSSQFASRYRPASIFTRQKIVLYSDAGDGGEDLKAALNLLRKSARVFSSSAALEEELDEEEIERQLDKEEQERQEQRKKEQEDKKKEKMGGKLSDDARESTGLLKMKAEDALTSSSVNHTNTTEHEIAFELQRRLDAFDRRAKRTRIVLLKKLALWAFEVCATTVTTTTSTQQEQGDGGTKQSRKQYRVDRNAFYSGMLLVHLHLAKYVGVAACSPPTRVQVDELFELADHDRSGHLDEEEFTNAVVVACAPISSRIATYWSLSAVLPVVVGSTAGILARLMRHYVDRMPSSWYRRSLALMEWTVEQALSILFFSILVPYLFNRIDRAARQRAIEQARRRNKNTTLWWLRLPGKNGNGNDFAANVKYWAEGLHNFVQSGRTARWGEKDSEDSDKAEEREDTTSSQIARSWKRPWILWNH